MKYFLGIDVGASKTHALIVDETGRAIGFGKAWGGNHQTVGYDGLENVLRESFGQACEMAGWGRPISREQASAWQVTISPRTGNLT